MSNSDLAERRGRIDEIVDDHEEWLSDHEQRLTKLEKALYITIGALAALSVVTGSSELATFVGLL